MSATSVCTSCGAPIVWAQTDRGARMPVDPAPHPDGTLVLTRTGAGYAVQVDPTAPGRKYRSHFASCPHAARHRRRGHR